MSGIRQVGIRLKPEGGAEVKNAAKEVERALDGMNNAAVAGADRATAATKRTVEQLKIEAGAAIAAESALQRQINATLGIGTVSPLTQRHQNAESKVLDRSAAALLAQLEPARVAQDRLNMELAEYDILLRKNKITIEQHAAAQALSRKRFDETTAALNRQGSGLSRNERASRLNLSRQASDVFVTAAMGMNPAMIAIQQGPQIMDAWATSGLKLSPVLVGLGVAAAGVAAAVGVLGYAYVQGEKNAYAFERAATGAGRAAGFTGQELKAAAQAGAEAGEISAKSSREVAIAYASTGKIGKEVMTGLVGITKDFASFIGKDVPEASGILAKSFSEPDKAAREMTRQFGLMDQETLKTIDSLVKQGDRLGAQKLLLEALTGAVSGHADQVSGFEGMWNRATTSLSNYLDKLAELMSTSPEERLANLEARANSTLSANGKVGTSQWERDQAQYALEREQRSQGVSSIADWFGAQASKANMEAQEEQDRKDKEKKGPKGKSAEQLAREALARQRREEDATAGQDMMIARAMDDFDVIQRLEGEARLRTRIRQLIDDGATAEEARVKATAEEVRLLEALKVQRDEAGLAIQRQTEMTAMRLLGDDRSIQNLQDRIDLEDAVLKYQQAGYDKLTATNMAEADRNRIIEARAEFMRRANEEAERDHQLNLARLSGDTDLYRYLDIEDRIERRAREIERRNNLNEGEGVEEARLIVAQELSAEATGARKAWMRGLMEDIRQGGIGDAIANQLDRATDHWMDKLAESLSELDWGGFVTAILGSFNTKGQDGSGWANAFSTLIGGGKGSGFAPMDKEAASTQPWLKSSGGFNWGDVMSWFGGHANGTEFSDGGWKWVGENGPELARVPRGAQVMDHNRSMMFAASQKQSNGFSIGTLKVENHGRDDMTASARMTPEGDLELILEPVVAKGIRKAGQTGDLARAYRQTPQTIKR